MAGAADMTGHAPIGATAPLAYPIERVPAPDLHEIGELKRRAVERFRNWQRRTVAEAIEIGADLVRVKRALGHGNFSAWLREEFPAEIRTAQRLMQIAARFADKNDSVSHLPLTAVYMLATSSTPETITGTVIAKLENGEPVDVEMLRAEISAARREARRGR